MVAESLFGVSATKRITETVSRCLYKGIFEGNSIMFWTIWDTYFGYFKYVMIFCTKINDVFDDYCIRKCLKYGTISSHYYPLQILFSI